MRRVRFMATCVCCAFLLLLSGSRAGNSKAADDLKTGLVGYWKLAGDCKDYSGQGNHGVNHVVEFAAKGPDGSTGGVAQFNGRSNFIEVPHNDSLSLGTSDFSMTVWVKCDESGTDTIGDIVSKYDVSKRKGLNFQVLDNQFRQPANRRNVLFGIDNAKTSSWTDCGNTAAPKSVGTFSLCVHKGKLYSGSYTRNNGARSDLNPQGGHVYRYEGGTRWADCGRLGKSSNVLTLASYKGHLYGGVAFDAVENGSAAKVYRYEEDSGRWIDCGQVGNSLRVECMAVFGGRLYAGTFGAHFLGDKYSVYRYEGGEKWSPFLPTSWTGNWPDKGGHPMVVSLGVYNDMLFAASTPISRYENGKWLSCGLADVNNCNQKWGWAIYRGNLYLGTYDKGYVYRWKGGEQWADCGRLTEEKNTEVMALSVYNGGLYGSVYHTGEVFRYEGDTKWTNLGQLGKRGKRTKVGTVTGELPPIWSRCYGGRPGASRIPALAVYQGKLFAGVWNWEFDLPGHVFSIEAGKSVTYDHELGAGWKHLAAVKEANMLKLFVDGQLIASSTTFNPDDFDISNNETLKIGFGTHDYFNGKMAQVRMYDRALADKEIGRLYQHK